MPRDTDPTAFVTKIETSPRGVRSLVVGSCPHCDKTHHHGGGEVSVDVTEYLGHRVSHCAGATTGGYYLALAPDVTF